MPENVNQPDPIGTDGPGGPINDENSTAWVTWMVNSTKHLFSAPKNKYSDLASVLGLTNVETDDKKKEGGLKLAGGSGYITLSVRTKEKATFSLVCDPAKVGDALKSGVSKKIYGKDIDRVYIPKKRILR